MKFTNRISFFPSAPSKKAAGCLNAELLKKEEKEKVAYSNYVMLPYFTQFTLVSLCFSWVEEFPLCLYIKLFHKQKYDQTRFCTLRMSRWFSFDTLAQVSLWLLSCCQLLTPGDSRVLAPARTIACCWQTLAKSLSVKRSDAVTSHSFPLRWWGNFATL